MQSPSARKVWIEISYAFCFATVVKSPSARKVWIEIYAQRVALTLSKSPSARKVWIEILHKPLGKKKDSVTFRKEGVD